MKISTTFNTITLLGLIALGSMSAAESSVHGSAIAKSRIRGAAPAIKRGLQEMKDADKDEEDKEIKDDKEEMEPKDDKEEEEAKDDKEEMEPKDDKEEEEAKDDKEEVEEEEAKDDKDEVEEEEAKDDKEEVEEEEAKDDKDEVEEEEPKDDKEEVEEEEPKDDKDEEEDEEDEEAEEAAETQVLSAEEFVLDLGACATTEVEVQRQASSSCDIVETAVAAGSFATLVDLVATAGLVETLQSPGPFTVFAPVNSAFPAGAALEEYKNSTDVETLTSVLTYHVIPGKIMASDLSDGLSVATVQGSNVTFSLMNGTMINDANIIATDIETTNGVIHVIDSVLMPDAAENANMETPDEPIAAEMDIVDTAITAGSFTVLADLLVQTGLLSTLKGDGPFTVFAPTDEAFGSEEEVEAIRALPAPTIAQILSYHVVPGQVMAADLSDGQQVNTVFGETFEVEIEDGAVTVDGANVVETDIMATNGVIHVIDQVIIPDAVVLP